MKLPTAPRLETPRLTLRPHLATDFPDCCAMWADSEVVRYIGGKPSTPQQVWSRILGYAGQWHFMNYGYWAIEEKNTGKFVGEMGFAEFMRDMVPSIKGVPEMGWALSPEFHGIGYGSEAIACALNWAELNLFQPKIACIISPDNKQSVKLAVKSGFKKECSTEYAGQPTDLYLRILG
ncbi:MAG: GNAT family N-acetyltransferase [Proteobacteria bacterium]|nr:GNAT family N-acetyltransferase [Pseudomonadota bacterium]